MEADPLTFKQGIAPCLSIILNRQINLNTKFMSRVLSFFKMNPLFRHPPHVLHTGFLRRCGGGGAKSKRENKTENRIKSNRITIAATTSI
jgi:hypothetical protein